MMLELQASGCHNINFVSPTHFAPQMARSILLAAEQGLRVPIVYNTNAYDAVYALQLLEEIVDVYLPDLKYADDESGYRLLEGQKLQRIFTPGTERDVQANRS